jgi:hypothetical protein
MRDLGEFNASLVTFAEIGNAASEMARDYEAKLAACERQVNELAEINKEMLEALKTLFDLANHFHVGDVWFSGNDDNRQALEDSEAAIRKAEQ